MSHSIVHARNSAILFGGKAEDYLPIHSWFDETKSHWPIYTHRALRHHSHGIFEAEKTFGVTITNSDGNEVAVRVIGEQHVREDCGGRIPTVADWLSRIQPEPWMSKPFNVVRGRGGEGGDHE